MKITYNAEMKTLGIMLEGTDELSQIKTAAWYSAGSDVMYKVSNEFECTPEVPVYKMKYHYDIGADGKTLYNDVLMTNEVDEDMV